MPKCKKNSPKGIVDTFDAAGKAVDSTVKGAGKAVVKFVDTTLQDIRSRIEKHGQITPPDENPDKEHPMVQSPRSLRRGNLFDKSWEATGSGENNPERKKPAPPM